MAKETIIIKATELFLHFGFKSVTMDDIAKEIGMSKKTIYVHFQNKDKLVEASTLYLCEQINNAINAICELNHDPIKEMFEIKSVIASNLKDETSSPQHQLDKYYPKVAEKLKKIQLEMMSACCKNNLQRGIDEGLFREDIDTEFIFKIYFSGIRTIRNRDLFPLKEFSQNQLADLYLEYHLRGICTEKGLTSLTNFTTQKK